ncbi:hypothetical protein CBM2586_A10967 [Cupriavidus phytorum]|uniref:Uncharacterized protein n=1 Tax=Cupriavidus taiwanensis TaxID=164546 RepID=A0A375BBT5_9BURK|nr:hypothetical protein CBM2586_A10967 [Cupriavidus taiwanensis]
MRVYRSCENPHPHPRIIRISQ